MVSMMVTTIPTHPKNTNKKSKIGLNFTVIPMNPEIHEQMNKKWSRLMFTNLFSNEPM